ncbi:MAG: tRNA (adenosine(37)-N6)-threonylcarbamoyltransferase complex transferase subunit TsaD, partial [Parcubacteria group bacterium]|nr:tRNA (adenosine(37)-N6)-threonylcarbamoyltransferase complex transferase subunit TsaD [Parcubacteria group bacterium]
SFSGLKTAVLYTVRRRKKTARLVADVCASAERAIVDVLAAKTIRAARMYQPRTVFLTGGVAANRRLREVLRERLVHGGGNTPAFHAPAKELSTDNAVMIAAAAYARVSFGRVRKNWKTVRADSNAHLSACVR